MLPGQREACPTGAFIPVPPLPLPHCPPRPYHGNRHQERGHPAHEMGPEGSDGDHLAVLMTGERETVAMYEGKMCVL